VVEIKYAAAIYFVLRDIRTNEYIDRILSTDRGTLYLEHSVRLYVNCSKSSSKILYKTVHLLLLRVDPIAKQTDLRTRVLIQRAFYFLSSY